MALHDRGAGFGQPHDGPHETPRLRLKRKAAPTGYVDGAWWPHSDDLTAELPDLVAVLSVRLGDVSRVMYNRAEWATAPRKLRVGDQVVRLDGYDRQRVHTVGVVDSFGANITLLVIPAQTNADDAHNVMTAAAAPDDASSVTLLLASGQPAA